MKFDKNEFSIFIFLDKLKDQGVILDVGANIGITAQVFCEKRNFEIKAFEPVKSNYDVLHRVKRLKRLSNLEILPFALGAEKGFVEMVMPINNGVIQQGLSHIIDKDSKQGSHEGIFYKVQIERLDDIVDTLNLSKNISGIKIDVEGFEYDVLLGALKTLGRHRPIIHIELWERGSSIKCLSLLHEQNYSVFGMKKKQLILVSEYQNFKSMSSNNFICIPN
ncbi:MAG: FkbM family methyltransferase [Candidatus Sericytochromatia bacterium]